MLEKLPNPTISRRSAIAGILASMLSPFIPDALIQIDGLVEYNPGKPRFVRHEIHMHCKEPITVVQVSDIHYGSNADCNEEKLMELVINTNKVLSNSPGEKYLFVTGDVINHPGRHSNAATKLYDTQRAFGLLSEINAVAKFWSPGNHENGSPSPIEVYEIAGQYFLTPQDKRSMYYSDEFALPIFCLPDFTTNPIWFQDSQNLKYLREFGSDSLILCHNATPFDGLLS